MESVKPFARSIVLDPEYLRSLQERADAGTLAPELARMLRKAGVDVPRPKRVKRGPATA